MDGASIGIIIDSPFFAITMAYALGMELGISVLYAKVPPTCVWGNVKFVIMLDATSVKVALRVCFLLG